jgi:hypothetical protein
MIMKSRFVISFLSCVLLAACHKKEPVPAPTAARSITAAPPTQCSKEIIASQPVKAGETGLILPAGTKICITNDQLEVRAELPKGYAFLSVSATDKPLPVYATYTCICSQVSSHCQVFYAEGMGFGCLQSSCTGSCTGKFTYAGYTVDRVVATNDKEIFFQLPEVKKAISKICDEENSTAAYVKLQVYGVPFYLVRNEALFKAKASCDCEGTQACTLKALGFSAYKVYYCDGPCNGCALTVN